MFFFWGELPTEVVMPGLVPPARPKPLRRGEGPGIHVLCTVPQGVDGRDKPGHDGVESSAPRELRSCER
ncbi:hypothetical protein BSZ19_34125 [Bradyrhizobium japonicum]|uniref:Uncharacterized protein n=1 Tax=Bradyrhizobium japonicum TaxID=375 RepID=A0A1Y2JIN3_BRAJP|nr:hypothetical protein BSZ19_34125 [Bradyrhizobium japonicum]